MASKKQKKYDENLYKEIRDDLLSQLDRNGSYGKQYENLIDDYMKLWVTKEFLSNDILERGVVTTYDNGGGQTGTKKNDSVAEMVKVNAQMIKLLFSLNLTPPKNVGNNDPNDRL